MLNQPETATVGGGEVDSPPVPVYMINISAKGRMIFTGLATKGQVEFRRTDGTKIVCRLNYNWKESQAVDFEPFRVYDTWNGKFIV